jgi:hypothetical protein
MIAELCNFIVIKEQEKVEEEELMSTALLGAYIG